MSKEMQIFKNNEFGQVRGILIDNEAYLVGKDVTEKLGYDLATNSYSKYIKQYCDEEDYMLMKKSDLDLFKISNTGRKGEYLINESGLYSLILSSKLPNAKKFKRWVTSEVLPQIRKTGGYLGIDNNMTEDDIFFIFSRTGVLFWRNKKSRIFLLFRLFWSIFIWLKLF